MALRFNSFFSAKSVPLAEREISFPGVSAEDTGGTGWPDLGPMPATGAETGVPATYTVGTETEKEVIPKEKRGSVTGQLKRCWSPSPQERQRSCTGFQVS